ncbi:MAG: TldD/PmbA family protein [Candidatus Methanofastidiosia archaeon]
MLDLCNYAVTQAEKLGATEAEAFIQDLNSIEVAAELGEISKVSKKQEGGIFVRLVKNKALGFSYTNKLDKNSIEDATKRAFKASKSGKKDEDWVSLPERGSYPDLSLWDEKIPEIPPGEFVRIVREMIEKVPKDIMVAMAEGGLFYGHNYCTNSNGIEAQDKGTGVFSFIYLIGKTDVGVTPGCFEFDASRSYELDTDMIVENAVRDVELSKKNLKPEAGLKKVVIAPNALEQIFTYTLFEAVSGENIVREKSALADKIGEVVSSERFSISDNALHEKGLSSRAFDSEGVSSQKTKIVDRGVLKSFIWDNYWAKRVGGKSTGNAQRSLKFGSISVRPTNMVVERGECSFEELIDVREGYLVKSFQGAHSSNPESGDFSVVCTPAFKIEEGEVVGGVSQMMLSDNIYNVLKRVSLIEEREKINQTLISPSIRFEGLNISTK